MVQNSAEKEEEKKSSNYSHLKWPALIMVILLVILVAVFDYCSRSGNI